MTDLKDNIVELNAARPNNSRDRFRRVIGVARRVNEGAASGEFGICGDEYADGLALSTVNAALSLQCEPLDLDAVANDLMQRMVNAWASLDLPVPVLASSAAAIGLQISCAEEGPAETAAGLQRIADEIMACVPTAPRHLI